MPSTTTTTTILEGEAQKAPHLSADEFQNRFFGVTAEPTRKQPWREQIDIKEHHYINVVSENLRLWGKHVAAHSWSVVS